MTWGGPPSELSDPARHAQGAARSLELLVAPTLDKRTPSHRPDFTHLRRARCHDVRGGTPAGRPSQMPDPQRGFRLRSISAGLT
eukprot:12988859-Alexandrium_andersonii.AAC.1